MTLKKIPLITAITLMSCSGITLAELKNFEVSGLVEAEVAFNNSDSNGDSSDILISTVELGFETTFSEQVSASFILLAEDIGSADQTSVEVDEAILNLPIGGATLTVGQTTAPFGKFETGTLSDPLTLELGETAETVIMYSRESESGLNYSVYIFNGDMDTGDDKIDDLGFDISMKQESWSAGIGYISNIADSDSITDVGGTVADDIAGLNLSGSLNTGSLTLILEYVAAMDDFVAGDLGGAITADAKPTAIHFEVDMDLGNDTAVALSYSSSDEAGELGLYETALAVAYTATVREHLGYAIEFYSADEYNGNSDTVFTVQMSLEF